MIIISVVSWFVVCFSNYKEGYGFVASRSSHVFFMGKLVENGILKKYLDETCAVNHYKLCNFKDELRGHAWDFVWNYDGAFTKSGGWDSSKAEYNSIIKATLLTPKYLWLHIKESIKATCNQLILTDAGDGLWVFGENSNPYKNIQASYPKDFAQYNKSIQNNTELRFGIVNIIYRYSIIIAFLLAVFLLFKRKNDIVLILFLSVVIFLIINAFATASFANILARLNSRAIWLLFFVSAAIITDYWRGRLKVRT